MHKMTYSKGDSFGAETEPCKKIYTSIKSINSPRHITVNSDDTNPLRSSYSISSPFLINSPVLATSPFCFSNYTETEVFERLVIDTNRRSENKVKITEFKQQQERKLIRTYSENEEVYDRLLKDTEYRKEKKEMNEQKKAQKFEESIKTARSNKTCTKEEADDIVRRLLCNDYTDSPRRTYEKEYDRKKNIDFFNSRVKTDKAKNSHGNKNIAKSNSNTGYVVMDICERTEVEMMYGKPGKPLNPDDDKKTVKKRRSMKSSGDFSGLIKKAK